MSKILTAVLVLAAVLFVAPIVETGTSGTTQYFAAIGNAEGGGGGD